MFDTRHEQYGFWGNLFILVFSALIAAPICALSVWVTLWIYGQWDSVGVFWFFMASAVGSLVAKKARGCSC